MKYSELERLIEIVATLRSENGCQWDREQTHKSLRPNMLEEAYEAVDAIDEGDISNLREELGDVLLQVVLHAQIAKDNGEFDIEDVAKELADKLIHRHPHVFGNQEVHSTKEILDNWERLKKEEKTYRKSVLDGVSKSQSALMAAQKISKKVVKVGFEWDSIESLKKCIQSEYQEFEEAVRLQDKDLMEDEMGDIFFATVNLARWHKIDAEQALLRANKKFTKRFKKMEEIAAKPLEEYGYQEFNELWKQAKEILKSEEQNG
ncbi:MAG: nucleoside triphosphate pyrophosphohydrolase [Cyanobacteria bacterium SIG28]|nr:nucleoside triphosphate pyrophosphohydrolase [Cyanobacteria bacterium SIG28]